MVVSEAVVATVGPLESDGVTAADPPRFLTASANPFAVEEAYVARSKPNARRPRRGRCWGSGGGGKEARAADQAVARGDELAVREPPERRGASEAAGEAGKNSDETPSTVATAGTYGDCGGSGSGASGGGGGRGEPGELVSEAEHTEVDRADARESATMGSPPAAGGTSRLCTGGAASTVMEPHVRLPAASAGVASGTKGDDGQSDCGGTEEGRIGVSYAPAP